MAENRHLRRQKHRRIQTGWQCPDCGVSTPVTRKIACGAKSACELDGALVHRTGLIPAGKEAPPVPAEVPLEP